MLLNKVTFLCLVFLISTLIGNSQNITISGTVDGVGMQDVKILKKLKKDIQFEGGISDVSVEISSGSYKKSTKTSTIGDYSLSVPSGKDYILKISKKEYSPLLYYIHSKPNSYSVYELRSIIQQGDIGSYNIGTFSLTNKWINFKENSTLDESGIAISNINLANKTAKQSITENRKRIAELKANKIEEHEEIGTTDSIKIEATNNNFLSKKIEKIGEKLNFIKSNDPLLSNTDDWQNIIDSAYSVLNTLEKSSKEYAHLKLQITSAESKLKDAKKIIVLKNQHIEEQNKVILYITLFLICLIVIIALLYIFYKKIEVKNKIISEKNSKIKNSIEYAALIQSALLTSKEGLNNFIPNSFIYYKPKDIVSGDFYWFKKIDDKLVIAAADSTGHGVPGALLTMLGLSALEKIVGQEKETSPAEILKKLDEDISEKLSDGAKYPINGMDISIITISKNNTELEYSGAMREITKVDTNGEITNYRPNLVSIASGRMNNNLKVEKLTIEKGDNFYMYSDGYQDQFKGGQEKIETFNHLRFQKLLSDIAKNDSISNTEQLLDKTLKDWKGDQEQIDDIMIMGLKF